jgi:2-dehydropantoate 2-reductase
MRIVVYGVGAIGGTVAAALALSGQEVIGIARGRMLEAIRDKGLTLNSSEGAQTVRFDCVGGPEEIDFRPDDAILLTMKGQDTAAALEALRAAGVRDQPIFCCQNGVANERAALRLFPNVHGVTVMMPATYIEPGEVSIFVAPRWGLFDIGRFPDGQDAADAAMAEALERANIAAFPMDDVMNSKYGKLLMNLGNITEAALGPDVSSGEIVERARAEGRAVLEAMGITPHVIGAKDPRREMISPAEVPGATSAGGSTTQSLKRGTGSVETDYLNGEISLLGRLHGVPTPVNDALTRLSAELSARRAPAGSMSLEELQARVG